MILGLEGEKSVEFFLVPAVAFHHVQFPHASACEHNRHIVTGEDGKLVVTQVDVLVPVVSLMTESAGPQTDLGEPPEQTWQFENNKSCATRTTSLLNFPSRNVRHGMSCQDLIIETIGMK